MTMGFNQDVSCDFNETFSFVNLFTFHLVITLALTNKWELNYLMLIMIS